MTRGEGETVFSRMCDKDEHFRAFAEKNNFGPPKYQIDDSFTDPDSKLVFAIEAIRLETIRANIHDYSAEYVYRIISEDNEYSFELTEKNIEPFMTQEPADE